MTTPDTNVVGDTANHVVLANMISGFDGDYNDDAQVFVSASAPRHDVGSSSVAVKLTDAVGGAHRRFIVTVTEA